MKPFETFLATSQQEMKGAGVKISMPEETHVPLIGSGLMCNGYFDDDPELIFACGIGKPIEQWMPIYVHEYGHFTQWRDKIPEWAGVTIDGLHYDDFIEKWLEQGKNFPQYKVNRFIDASIVIEADCERRAIELIKKYNLPIDPLVYAQTANSYVHFYNYIKCNRVWYTPGKEPYKIKEVYSQFNTTMDSEFQISYEYNDLFKKYCI